MKKITEVQKAYERVAVLKRIVEQERVRAETNPLAQRNVDLGLVQLDLPYQKAKDQISRYFSELTSFLDHLHVAHVAAAFEQEAKARVATTLGEARKTIKLARKGQADWPVRLLIGMEQVDGLKSLENILNFDGIDTKLYRDARLCRNNFGHSVDFDQTPAITSLEAAALFVSLVETIK